MGHRMWGTWQGVGDSYWSLALPTAWCAGVWRAGTRKINGQKRCLRSGLRLGLGPGVGGFQDGCGPGLEAGREVRVAVGYDSFSAERHKGSQDNVRRHHWRRVRGDGALPGPGADGQLRWGTSASVYATVREPGVLGRIGLGESTEIKTGGCGEAGSTAVAAAAPSG